MRPILDQDVPAVSRFLYEHMNRRPGIQGWRRLMAPPWEVPQPNHGFQLVTQSGIVGAYVAVYSSRTIDGLERRICNLAAFCVLPEHRQHGLRLYRAILAQRGFEFTDLSPSGNVIKLNERMGFKRLDTASSLVPNYPRPLGRKIVVSDDPEVVRSNLVGADLAYFDDHRNATAARHLVASAGGAYAYLIYRRDRRKNLPIFASPLYVGGSSSLLESAWPAVSTYLLRRGLLATLAERRVLGFVPTGGVALRTPRQKMFRSRTVGLDDIDYLYSELTLLEW